MPVRRISSRSLGSRARRRRHGTRGRRGWQRGSRRDRERPRSRRVRPQGARRDPYQDIELACTGQLPPPRSPGSPRCSRSASSPSKGGRVPVHGRTAPSRLRFTDAPPTHARFPALDGASQESSRLQVKLAPAGTQRTTKERARPARRARRSTRSRLEFPAVDRWAGLLPCVTDRGAHRDGDDGSRMAARGAEVADLVVTTSFDAAGVDDWHQWHEASVVAGKAVQKRGRSRASRPLV